MTTVIKPVHGFLRNHALKQFKNNNLVEWKQANQQMMFSEVVEELFVKIPQGNCQQEISIMWKDVRINSITLFNANNEEPCFAKKFENAVSVHSINGVEKGRYLAHLVTEHGIELKRILVLL